MDKKRELNTRETVRVVTANNFVTASGLEKTSLKARKLLYLAISQCKKSDKEFYEYEISVKDFAKIMDIEPTNVYQTAKKICRELLNGVIECDNPITEEYSAFTVFNKCRYSEKTGIIQIKLNEEMTPLLLELQKDFTQPLLNDFIRMNSNYSIEVWHLMQKAMKSKKPIVDSPVEFYLTLEELRKATNTENKHKQLVHFKQKVLEKAIREIKDNCRVVIEYENIRKGRTIVGFLFTAKSAIKLPGEKKRLETETKKMIFNLTGKAKTRELTPKEKEEYNKAIKNAKQIGLDEWLNEFVD